MKRLFALCLLVLAAACQRDSEEAAEPPGPPFAGRSEFTAPLQDTVPGSVVIVLVDALRADWLGAYGSQRGLTPELDRLAEQAFVFEAAYATSAWTRSSIGSLFTARYPSAHAALTRDDALPQRNVTLAEALEAHESFWSFGVTTNPNAGAAIGFDQGFDYFDRPDPELAQGYPEDALRLIPAEAVTARALQLFDQRSGPDQPVFAFLHYIDPHDPYMAHPGLLEEPEPPGALNGSRTALDELQELGRDGGTPENIARLEFLYAGEVRYTDHWIGELLRGFQQRGALDDMLLIVVADHGEAFFEHDKRGHGQSLYETQLRVPLILKLPGMQPGDGVRIAQPVSLVDVAPTVLHAWGIASPAGFQGFTLAPLLFGKSRGPAFDYIFSELQINPNARRFALKHQNWKIIVSEITRPDGEERTVRELFDLATDPAEKRNLAADEAYNDELLRLEASLLQWEDEVRRQGVRAEAHPMEELDEKALEELRGLGYVQ